MAKTNRSAIDHFAPLPEPRPGERLSDYCFRVSVAHGQPGGDEFHVLFMASCDRYLDALDPAIARARLRNLEPPESSNRLSAALAFARGRMTGRTPEQVEEDIHRARLANLEPPELGESLEDYCARMVRVHGTTYRSAAVEFFMGQRKREGVALRTARKVLKAFTLRPK
jgi:hypothetical protein